MNANFFSACLSVSQCLYVCVSVSYCVSIVTSVFFSFFFWKEKFCTTPLSLLNFIAAANVNCSRVVCKLVLIEWKTKFIFYGATIARSINYVDYYWQDMNSWKEQLHLSNNWRPKHSINIRYTQEQIWKTKGALTQIVSVLVIIKNKSILIDLRHELFELLFVFVYWSIFQFNLTSILC